MSNLNHCKEATKTIMQYAGGLTEESVAIVTKEVMRLNFYSGMALEDDEISIEMFNEYQAFADHVCECITDFHKNNPIEVAQC